MIVVAEAAAEPSWAAGAVGASTSIVAAETAASVSTPTREKRFFMFEPSPVRWSFRSGELSESGRARSTGRSAYLCAHKGLRPELVAELARREEDRFGEGRVRLDRVQQHLERHLGADRERHLLEPLPRLRPDRDRAHEHAP